MPFIIRHKTGTVLGVYGSALEDMARASLASAPAGSELFTVKALWADWPSTGQIFPTIPKTWKRIKT